MLGLHANKPYHFLLVHCNTYTEGVSVILALQCIDSIKKHFPSASISFLLHSSMQDFFQNHPCLAHIFCIDKTPNLAGRLKAAKITLSVSLMSDKKSTIALFRSGIKTRIGVFKQFYTLLFNYKIKQKRSISKQHEAFYNLDLLKPLGCMHVVSPKIYLSISEKQRAHNYLSALFGADCLLYSGCIVIYPGNGLRSVGWSMKNLFHLASELARTNNVLIIGASWELEGYTTLISLYPNLSIRNLALYQGENKQHSNMREILGIISHAQLFIGNNTTLLHAAAALDVPTLSFFPYKKPLCPNRYAPFHSNRKHVILTPFGIFNIHDSLSDEAKNSNHGLNMESIELSLVLNVLYAKILGMPDKVLPPSEQQVDSITGELEVLGQAKTYQEGNAKDEDIKDKDDQIMQTNIKNPLHLDSALQNENPQKIITQDEALLDRHDSVQINFEHKV